MRKAKSYLRGLSADASHRAAYAAGGDVGRAFATVMYFVLGAVTDAARGY